METNDIFVCGQSDVSDAPDKVKLLPLGLVKSQKGDFTVDEESFRLMRAKFIERKNDVVIDYEHQTLKDVQAPAGGWIKDIFIEDGAIVAKVEWTEKAKKYLGSREYRYLSPVVHVRKSDSKAVILHSAALTNTPAINGMYPITCSLNFEEGDIQNMELLGRLSAILGLGDGASEEQVLDTVKAMSDEAKKLKKDSSETESKVVSNKVICDLLGVKTGAATEDVAAAIVSLKRGADSAAELIELKKRLDERDADDAVIKALKTGKLIPPLKEWATAYALKDPSGFAAFIDKAPQLVPMGELELETSINKENKGFDEATLLICKQLGISGEDLEKYGKES